MRIPRPSPGLPIGTLTDEIEHSAISGAMCEGCTPHKARTCSVSAFARRLIIETALKDGTPVCLRSIRPSDEARLREGIRDLSDRSRYLRFFSAFRDPPPAIVKRLSAVDGHDHIGWGAIRTDLDEPLAIGAAHAIRLTSQPCRGELAIALLDDYHGQGLARMLIAAVLLDCANEEMPVLEMQLMAENAAAIGLVIGLGARRIHGPGAVSHFELDVPQALAAMRDNTRPGGVADVLAAHPAG
jgi:GNAT superfamily N-acetyltransferase